MGKIICFLQGNVGGAERMTINIGNHLARSGHNVLFVIIWNGKTPPIIDMIPVSMPSVIIPSRHGLQLAYLIFKTLKKEKPAFVFSSVININNKILLCKPFFPKIKYIIRCDNYYYTYSRSQQFIIRIVYPFADVVIAQTKEMQEELINLAKVSLKKTHVLENPLDKEDILSKISGVLSPYPNNGKKHIVAVGRYSYQKGFDLLIKAFALICQKRDDVELYIVGDYNADTGIIFSTIKQMVFQYNISSNVYQVGYQKNPYPYLKFADCFVLSSRWEGLPNVLIESQYLGTPAAAFKCVPVVERIIVEGENGYLAQKGDVDSLSQAIGSAIEMGRIKSSYVGSQLSDFAKLFS